MSLNRAWGYYSSSSCLGGMVSPRKEIPEFLAPVLFLLVVGPGVMGASGYGGRHRGSGMEMSLREMRGWNLGKTQQDQSQLSTTQEES